MGNGRTTSSGRGWRSLSAGATSPHGGALPGLPQRPPPAPLSPGLARPGPRHPEPPDPEAGRLWPSEGQGRTGRAPRSGASPSPLVSLPPSLVPEERGGQLRAPGCFQCGPADGEHRSNTGERGFLPGAQGFLPGARPPGPLSRAQGPISHLSSTYLLSTYYVPGTILGTWAPSVSHQQALLRKSRHSSQNGP